MKQQTVNVTAITYDPPSDTLPTELVFEFDEPIDNKYIQNELLSHIEEYITEEYKATNKIESFASTIL